MNPVSEKRKELLGKILNSCSKKEFNNPIYFLIQTPCPDETARFGIESINEKPSFCFHGQWFSNNLSVKKNKEPITDSEIVIRELDNLGRYIFKNYPTINGFFQEIKSFYNNFLN